MNLSTYFKEFSYNIRLSFPVILGMLGHTLVAFIDNVMVGQLGVVDLAAVSLGNSTIFVAMSFGIGFSMAITPLVAKSVVENNTSDVQSTFKNGVVLCTMWSVLLFFLLFAFEPLMKEWQPDEVVRLAIPYTRCVSFSLIPLILFQALKQFSDGLSLTKYALYATVAGNLLNVLLNYVLIFGNWGFPAWGILGAGVGTLLSRFLMLWVMWLLLSKTQKTKPYVTGLSDKWIDTSKIKELFSIGIPSAMQVVFEVGIFTSAVWLSGVLGKDIQAANQIALNLSSMTFMVASGLSVAAMIRVGNQKGFKDYINLRRIAISVFLLIFLLDVVFALFFSLFRNELPLLYLSAEDVNRYIVTGYASELLLIAAIFQISDGLQVVILGALRGLQDVKIPMWITFFAYWVVGLPISYYLGLYTRLSGMGIWIGLLSGLTVAAAGLAWRFNRITKKLIRENPLK